MWLITTTGFYSIVQKPGEKGLTIRSRVRKDLEALRDKYLPDLGEIVRNEKTDYRYRAKVSHADLAKAASQMVLDIDYDNFKNTVAKVQGHDRSHIYSNVWEDLLVLEKEES
jgi:phage tail tube protein FII